MIEHEKNSEITETEEVADAVDVQENQTSSAADDFMSNPDIAAYLENAIQDGIKKALKGSPPKANTADVSEQEHKNFDKMTYRERLNLFKSNPQTYYKFTKNL